MKLKNRISLKTLFVRWNLPFALLLITVLIISSCKDSKNKSSEIALSVDKIETEIEKNNIVSSHEAKGLNLLRQMISSSELDKEIINSVQDYTNAANHTKLSREIVHIFNLIQEQGNITDNDMEALDHLMSLISIK